MEKLFGTDGIRGIANKHPVTPELMVKVGKAAAIVLSNNKKRPKILIGKDTRLSGYMIETALTSGICSMGADVLLVGPMPTPAISHLTKSFAADAGIVISASHNPANHNGIKFFSKEGLKLSKEIEDKIEKLALNDINSAHINGGSIGKAYRIDDARGRYIEFAKASIKNRNLSGIKIVLDCANGAAYSVAPIIFQELGAEVIVVNNRPNGLNINLNCGSLYPEVIQKIAKKEKADIGVALDGDADRVAMVDENGDIIDGDQIMAVCGLHMLKNKELKNNTLVATVMSNFGLDEAVKKAGGRVFRTQVGDSYVMEGMIEHDSNFGGEQSGHIIFGDYSTTGDGIITTLKILDIMKEKNAKLSKLASSMAKYPQVLINVKVREKKPFEKMPSFTKIRGEEERLKGSGRVLVRYSGTENLARVMVEGKNIKDIQNIADNIAEEIRKEVGD